MQKRADKGHPKDPYLRLSVQPTMMLVDEAIPNGLVIVGSDAIEAIEEPREGSEDVEGERKKEQRPVEMPAEWELLI